MADTAEINANTVISLDLGNVSEGASFKLPPNFNSAASWALFGNLARQGLEGVVAGIDTGLENGETVEQRKDREEREKLSQDLLQFELIRGIDDFNKQIEALKEQIETLVQYLDKLQTERTQLLADIDTLETQLEENITASDNIQKSYNYHNVGLRNMLPGQTKETLDSLIEIEKTFITVRADLTGKDGQPIDGQRRYIVFKNKDGEYAIKHPQTGEELLIKDLEEPKMDLFGDEKGKHFTMLEDIKMQEAKGSRHFGNTAQNNEVKQFFAGQTELFNAIPAGTLRRRIIGFRDTMRYQEIQLHKLGIEREKIEQKLETLRERLEQNGKQIELSKEQLKDYRKQLKALEKQRDALESRKDALETEAEETAQYTAQTTRKIKTLFDTAAKMQANGSTKEKIIAKLYEEDKTGDETKNDATDDNLLAKIALQMLEVQETKKEHKIVTQASDEITIAIKSFAGRHEFLQKHYGDHVGEWQKMALDNLPEWAVEKAAVFAASDAVKAAWDNPITHEGNAVYRDNDTLELYTYDEETGARTYIDDPKTVIELYRRADVNAELFMNETPNSKDPKNSFVATLKDLTLGSDKIQKAAQKARITSEFNVKAEEAKLEELKQETKISLAKPAARDDNAGKLGDEFSGEAADTPKPRKTQYNQTPTEDLEHQKPQ